MGIKRLIQQQQLAIKDRELMEESKNCANQSSETENNIGKITQVDSRETTDDGSGETNLAQSDKEASDSTVKDENVEKVVYEESESNSTK